MRIVIDYQPTNKQKLFHASPADEVLYGGAAGGGKSRAIIMEAFIRCATYPGTRAYIFRRTYRELEDTLIAEAIRAIPKVLYKYNSTRHEMVLPNGSIMKFRQCMQDTDVFSYQGSEIHWLFIDELTQFSQAVFDFLKTRLRASRIYGIKPVVRATANPGGPGHSWVKAYFVDRGKPFDINTITITSELLRAKHPHTIQYIPATVLDNPHISEAYIYELEKKPRALRDALLLGKWDAFEGQAFPEFTDDIAHYGDSINTHVISPFDIPAYWPRYRSFDFGYARPFSVGWWAVDPEGVVYRYREWYGASGANVGLRIHPREIALGIKAREIDEKSVVYGIADPSIWDGSRGESVAAQMESAGVSFVSANNARIAGKMELHRRFAFDKNGRPSLYVFSNCEAFIRTIPALAYDPGRVEDIDTRAEDHVYDETRYFLMECPISARPQRHRKLYSPLD